MDQIITSREGRILLIGTEVKKNKPRSKIVCLCVHIITY